MIFAAAALGAMLGFILGRVWASLDPHVFVPHYGDQHLVAMNRLKELALREIKAYQDEREAQYRTIRQRARHRQKRPVR